MLKQRCCYDGSRRLCSGSGLSCDRLEMKPPRVIRGSAAPQMMMKMILLLLLLSGVCIDSYKPVVIVHGIFDGPKQFKKLSSFITEVHPGTEVTVIDIFDKLASLMPLWWQVQAFRKAIIPIMQKAPDGIHLLCFSQDTDYLKWIFPHCMKKMVYLICYNGVGQKVSICDYWNAWRENFLRIKKLVLIGGPDDGVITPWQSSLFGFYNSNETVVQMKDQEFYKNDTFGLRTLNARGDVSECVHSGVKHTHWHSNFTVFRSCMEKWLT
ncbi:hypothetical protein PAMP_002738 [Pampus punctatissimus]